MDARQLQRIDTSVFGNDKFAFEMLHYLKMNHRSNAGSSISDNWDRNFLRGLETLLVECAVVKDDVERDCFVTRLYSWFTEKLVDRRDLPRGIIGKPIQTKIRISLAPFSERGDRRTQTVGLKDGRGTYSKSPGQIYTIQRINGRKGSKSAQKRGTLIKFSSLYLPVKYCIRRTKMRL